MAYQDPYADEWWTQNAPPTDPAAAAFTPTQNLPSGVSPASGPMVTNLQLGGTPGARPAGAAAPGGTAPTLNPSDAASRRAFISYYANQPGANPSLKNDPGYWDAKIASGELGADPKYIISKFMTPEGAPSGGLGAPGLGAPGTITAPFGETFTPPAPVNLGGPAGIEYIPPVPTFNAPQWKPPSVDEALNSPGYQFRTQQGNEGLQHWAAAKGTLNDSGTAKALIDYNQNAASQEYQQVWNRDFQGYQQNYQAAKDAFAPQVLDYSTKANAGQQQTQLNYQNGWQRFLQDWTAFTDQRNSTWQKNFDYATA